MAGRYYYRLLEWYTPEKQEDHTSQYNTGQSGNRQQAESIIRDTTSAVKQSYTAL